MSQTTVILGAGASADFDLPLGNALYAAAQGKLQNFQDTWSRETEDRPGWDWGRISNFFWDDPTSLSIVKFLEKDNGKSIAPAYGLLKLMTEAPVPSIDTLAFENSNYLGLCKSLVASIIIERIREGIAKSDNGTEEWRFMKRMIVDQANGNSHQQNWIHLFTAMMRNMLTVNPEHKFKFVSFNYDMLFEQTLRRLWDLPDRSLGNLDDIVEFTYPHGSISWGVDHQGHSTFDHSARNIVFAHNKEDRGGFDKSREFIGTSNLLLSLGFNFAKENTDSLNLAHLAVDKHLIYQNFDGSVGLARRVDRLRLASVEAFEGPIASAIMQEKLGDLLS